MGKRAAGRSAAARYNSYDLERCGCAECKVARVAAVERMKARGITPGSRRPETVARWAKALAAKAEWLKTTGRYLE